MTCWFHFEDHLRGAEVRASFLQDTNAISQTIEFLINRGCTRQGTTAVAVSREV